jgi:hypothetical protein
MLQSFQHRPLIAAMLVFLFSCLIGFTVFQRELNTNGDNGTYLCYAISLAQGDGFRLANYPDHPKSTQLPILFPLLLAAFIKISGFNLLLLKAVMLTVFGLMSAVFFLLARKSLEGRLLYGLLMLTISNYWLLDNASITMSELTFTLLLLSGVYFLARHEEEKRPWPLALACAFLLLSPFVRTIGFTGILAFQAYLIYTKRYRLAAGSLAAFLGLYLLHQKALMGPGDNYLSALLLKEPYSPELGHVGPLGFLQRMGDNAIFYATNTVEMTLLSFMSEEGMGRTAGGLIFTGLFVALLFLYPPRRLKQERLNLFIRVFVLFYLGVLLTWPKVWSGSRFVVPIIPFLFLIAFQNVRYLLDRFLQPVYKARALGLIAAVSTVWAALNYGAIYKKAHEPLTPDWRDYYALAQWSGPNLPEGSVVCARSPFLFYLKSGRLCLPIPFTADREKALAYLAEKKIDYMVIDHFKWTGSTQAYVAPLIQIYPDRFTPVSTKPEAILYRFNHP